jgi:tRNA (uracil-5-)-methyltransferase
LKPGTAHPEQYPELLEQKAQLTREQFQEYFHGDLEIFPSEPLGFRMRAEFRIWHEGERSHYTMFGGKRNSDPIFLERFEIGSERIQELMSPLMERILRHNVLRHRLYQIEFLTTLSGQALITLIYHKPLDDEWQSAAAVLERELNCHIIGRSRKQKCVLSQDYVTETLDLDIGPVSYQQVETGFTQPNAKVCISMLNWALKQTEALQGDLLELYCGNGNFTIPLSHRFERVLATELSKVSTRSAEQNIAANKRSNITLARLAAEEVTQAFDKVRTFNRLKDIHLDDFDFSTVFVDPPRSGLDENTVELVRRFDNIVYISCNPDTLYKNIQALSNTHSITQFALFDQFPYTDHRECGTILQRKGETP